MRGGRGRPCRLHKEERRGCQKGCFGGIAGLSLLRISSASRSRVVVFASMHPARAVLVEESTIEPERSLALRTEPYSRTSVHLSGPAQTRMIWSKAADRLRDRPTLELRQRDVIIADGRAGRFQRRAARHGEESIVDHVSLLAQIDVARLTLRRNTERSRQKLDQSASRFSIFRRPNAPSGDDYEIIKLSSPSEARKGSD